MDYRGVLDIDGNVNAWGLYWRLASGSVVYRVDSEFSNPYTTAMKPWVHYIPIAGDLSNLISMTHAIQSDNTSLAENIVKNAEALIQGFTYEKEVERMAKELNALWS